MKKNEKIIHCIFFHLEIGKIFFFYIEIKTEFNYEYFSFRKALKCLIIQKSFDYSILFFIALNCITLAMERPSIPSISFVCYH